METFLIFGVCLGGMSIFFLGWGILIRLGYLRASYATKGNPVLASPALLHSLIFLGLAIGTLAILPFFPKDMRSNIVTYGFSPLLILMFVVAIWQPRWLKPKWLRQLEQTHSDIIEILWEEIRNEGHNWEKRVNTRL